MENLSGAIINTERTHCLQREADKHADEQDWRDAEAVDASSISTSKVWEIVSNLVLTENWIHEHLALLNYLSIFRRMGVCGQHMVEMISMSDFMLMGSNLRRNSAH